MCLEMRGEWTVDLNTEIFATSKGIVAKIRCTYFQTSCKKHVYTNLVTNSSQRIATILQLRHFK